MKISLSNVSMASERSMLKTGFRRAGTAGYSGSISEDSISDWKNTFNMEKGADKEGDEKRSYFGKGTSGIDLLRNAYLRTENPVTTIRNQILQILMQRFESSGIMRLSETPLQFGNSLYPERDMITVSEASYYEEENTSFYAEGEAHTADGRVINFSVELEMSRTFMEYSSVTLPNMASALMDPLVVNVSAATATVSDQKFLFDLDTDGVKEYISMPTAGSGFLALDKDGNGMIDNGSELFGTSSGDGFADLRQYDSDGNGWIDEDDAIYDMLRVWYKNPDGTDELVDLKKVDIGAIFLGNQSTEFSLMGGSGDANAVIRSTGIFLKESGGVGTIQHVDIAAGKEKGGDTGFVNVFGNDGFSIPGWGTISGGFGTNRQSAVYDRLFSGIGGLDEDDTGKSVMSGGESAAVDSEVARSGTDERAESLRRRQEYRKAGNAAAAERARRRKQLNRELAERRFEEHEDEEERIEKLLEERAEKNAGYRIGRELDGTVRETLMSA